MYSSDDPRSTRIDRSFQDDGVLGDPYTQIRPVHVAAYIEQLCRSVSAPTVKQNLAAVRMLFDYLVVGQVIEMNPAAAVKGPSYSTKKGKTPVL